VLASSTAFSKGIFAAATNSANQRNKAGSMQMTLVSTCYLSLYFSLDIYVFYSSSEQSQGKNKQRIEDISTDHTTHSISTTITPLVCNYCKQFNIYSIKNILIKDMKILSVSFSIAQ
jgi:hypothetical protein